MSWVRSLACLRARAWVLGWSLRDDAMQRGGVDVCRLLNSRVHLPHLASRFLYALDLLYLTDY